MKCFPHLSLLCSQTPTSSHFGSIIYFIARDYFDHISHCTNLELYVLSYCHVLSYCIDSELLRVTVLNTVETHMIPARLTSQRGSLWKCWMIHGWVGEASLTTWYSCTVLHHACYKDVSAGEREWGGINREKSVSRTLVLT